MKWTVVYRPDAADQLAEIWIKATDRQAVADAANLIDGQLGTDPLSAGESRDENSRVILQDSLVVFFDVSEQDRSVSVWAVNVRT